MIYKHEIEAFNEFWLDCDRVHDFSITFFQGGG